MSDRSYTETIEHEGIVQKSDDQSVTVKILSASACSGCHAKDACTLSGVEEKILEVEGSFNVAAGDAVTIIMKKSTGFIAVILSYIIPLILLICTLVILTLLKASELTAGVLSVTVLIPYYFFLWLFRNRISRNFTFTLKT